jgi:hypothetical protein
VLSILIGLILMALGVWGIVDEGWRGAVVAFVQGGLVILAILVGLGVFVFGLSELRAGAEEPPVMEPPSDDKPAGESPSQ